MSGAIPAWVPNSVQAVARELPDSDAKTRLLTDPRMETVWDFLLRQDVSRADAEAFFWPETLKEPDWGPENFTHAEIACAMIFVHIVEGLNFPVTIETRAERDALARPWLDAAEQCRTARRELGDFLEREPELPPALETVADYLEWRGKSLREKGNPFIVERSSKERGDDATRTRVRGIAALTFSIYGKVFYSIVATLASVALGVVVEKKSVEDWCVKIPHYLKDPSQ